MIYIKKYWIIFFAFVFAFIVNETNLLNINYQDNATELIINNTIYNVDNNFYQKQFNNLIKYNSFTININEPELAVRRTPIYPFFYGIINYLFGNYWGGFFIRYFQLLLFAISAYLLFKLTLCISKRVAIITAVIYSIYIPVISYTYYTLPEGIYPFFNILSLYLFFKFINTKKTIYLLLSAIFISISILTKPTSIVILFGLGSVLLFMTNKFWLKRLLIYCTGILLVFSPWIIRNYFVVKDFVPLEKFYHNSSMDFGRQGTEYKKFVSCYYNPAEANINSDVFLSKIYNDTNINITKNYVNKYVPDKVFKIVTQTELINIFHNMQLCYLSERLLINDKYIPNKVRFNQECDIKIETTFKELINKYKEKYFFDYYLLTPLNNFKRVVFNSNTASVYSLNPESDFSFIQKVIKGLYFILNSLLFSSFFIFLFIKTKFIVKFVSVISVLSMYFVLFYVYRTIEMRYFIPISIFLIVSLSIVIDRIIEIIQFKILNK